MQQNETINGELHLSLKKCKEKLVLQKQVRYGNYRNENFTVSLIKAWR